MRHAAYLQIASQIEYWATLGQIVAHTGLSVQEAHTPDGPQRTGFDGGLGKGAG